MLAFHIYTKGAKLTLGHTNDAPTLTTRKSRRQRQETTRQPEQESGGDGQPFASSSPSGRIQSSPGAQTSTRKEGNNIFLFSGLNRRRLRRSGHSFNQIESGVAPTPLPAAVTKQRAQVVGPEWPLGSPMWHKRCQLATNETNMGRKTATGKGKKINLLPPALQAGACDDKSPLSREQGEANRIWAPKLFLPLSLALPESSRKS